MDKRGKGSRLTWESALFSVEAEDESPEFRARLVDLILQEGVPTSLRGKVWAFPPSFMTTNSVTAGVVLSREDETEERGIYKLCEAHECLPGPCIRVHHPD